MTKMGRAILGASALFLLVVAVAARAEEASAAKGKGHARAGARKAVLRSAEEMKWADVPGAPPGVKQAVLWGDPAKGAFGALQKFVPGFSAPLHTHSSDLSVVVISGTMIDGPEGGPEKKLPAGSYLFLPSTYKHTTRCDAGSECVFFVEAKGKFDVKMVGEKKEAGKK